MMYTMYLRYLYIAETLAQDGASPVDISLPHDKTRPSTITRYPGNCLHPSSALHSQERPFRCVYFIRLTGPVSVGRRHESYASPQHIVVSGNETWSNFSHSRHTHIYIYICVCLCVCVCVCVCVCSPIGVGLIPQGFLDFTASS